MEKLPRQVYTNEFRQQAVELIIRDGLGIAEAARRLSVSPKTQTNRVKRARRGGSSGTAAPPVRSRSWRPSCHACGGRTLNCGWSATS